MKCINANRAIVSEENTVYCCRMQASRFFQRGSSSEEDEEEEETEEETESESDSDSDASGDGKGGASKCGPLLAMRRSMLRTSFGLILCPLSHSRLCACQHGPHSCCRLRVRRFLVGSDSSDSDDDKRVVRSAKDRRFEELNATCAELRVRPGSPQL